MKRGVTAQRIICEIEDAVIPYLGALAEFERNLIRERTYAGLAAARARGRKGGRRKKLGEKQRGGC